MRYPPSEKSARQLLADLNFCGCGDQVALYTALRCLLELHDCGDPGTEIYERKTKARKEWLDASNWHYLLAFLLDNAGFTEHGSLIDFQWLNSEGEAVLAFLNEQGCDPKKWPRLEGAD
jgi:hypothetical protein